jgi:ATP-dependent RNA helicase RhlE
MPKAIKQLADQYLTDPAEVSVTPVASTAERVEQRLTYVNQAEKTALLIQLLKSEVVERALVFSRTKHGADKIVRLLEAAGLPASAIHGNKSQAQRERAIAAFKSGEVNVLVATDIAARGIDIPGVSHVFNYDLPDVPEQYVHRIGRTARAGADGIAIAFCSPDERGNLRDIERLTKQRLAADPLPQDFASAVAATKALKPVTPKRGGRGGNGGQRDHRPNRHPAHRQNASRPTGQRNRGNHRRRARG